MQTTLEALIFETPSLKGKPPFIGLQFHGTKIPLSGFYGILPLIYATLATECLLQLCARVKLVIPQK